jgi:hypothetical protein
MREVEEKDAEGSPQDGRELFEWRLAYTGDSSTDGVGLSTTTLR